MAELADAPDSKCTQRSSENADTTCFLGSNAHRRHSANLLKPPKILLAGVTDTRSDLASQAQGRTGEMRRPKRSLHETPLCDICLVPRLSPPPSRKRATSAWREWPVLRSAPSESVRRAAASGGRCLSTSRAEREAASNVASPLVKMKRASIHEVPRTLWLANQFPPCVHHGPVERPWGPPIQQGRRIN